jgi:hypothetical protein
MLGVFQTIYGTLKGLSAYVAWSFSVRVVAQYLV